MSRIPTRQAILGWGAMAPCAHGPMLDLNALFIAPSHGRNEVGALLGGYHASVRPLSGYCVEALDNKHCQTQVTEHLRGTGLDE